MGTKIKKGWVKFRADTELIDEFKKKNKNTSKRLRELMDMDIKGLINGNAPEVREDQKLEQATVLRKKPMWNKEAPDHLPPGGYSVLKKIIDEPT